MVFSLPFVFLVMRQFFSFSWIFGFGRIVVWFPKQDLLIVFQEWSRARRWVSSREMMAMRGAIVAASADVELCKIIAFFRENSQEFFSSVMLHSYRDAMDRMFARGVCRRR